MAGTYLHFIGKSSENYIKNKHLKHVHDIYRASAQSPARSAAENQSKEGASSQWSKELAGEESRRLSGG